MTTAILIAIVFLAFLVEAALGFGATVVTVALGAFFFPIDKLLPAFVPLNLVLSSYILLRYGKTVDWRLLLLRIVPLMGLGLPLGFLIFNMGENRLLKVVFGAFVIVLSTLEIIRLLRERRVVARPLAGAWRTVLLLAGGIIHGVFATGGPMAVYVAGRELLDKARFRSTLSTLWLILNAALVVGYGLTGALDRGSAETSLLLALPLLGGLLSGEWIHHRVNLKVFREMVFGLLFLAGLLLVVTTGGGVSEPP